MPTKLGFLFTGQGSQYPGMGRELHQSSAEAREIFARADAALGDDLTRLCFEGDAEALARTDRTQPAILTVSCAAFAAFEALALPVEIVGAAGHSLGEYSALVAAGALEFEDAVRLVRRRGELMLEAVPAGAGGMLAARGKSLDDVNDAVATVSGEGHVVEIANLNSPKQIVVAGSDAGLTRLAELLGRRALRLPVSTPFHCSLMRPAAEAFGEALDGVTLRDPNFPVLSNVTGEAITDATAIRELLVAQMASAVRWQPCVETLIGLGCERLLELGPKRALAGLAGQIMKAMVDAGSLAEALPVDATELPSVEILT